MKFLTNAELKQVLQHHFRRHIESARFLTDDASPVLEVVFTTDKKNDYNIRAANS